MVGRWQLWSVQNSFPLKALVLYDNARVCRICLVRWPSFSPVLEGQEKALLFLGKSRLYVPRFICIFGGALIMIFGNFSTYVLRVSDLKRWSGLFCHHMIFEDSVSHFFEVSFLFRCYFLSFDISFFLCLKRIIFIMIQKSKEDGHTSWVAFAYYSTIFIFSR